MTPTSPTARRSSSASGVSPDGNKGLQITGGPGVGTVTRPGTGIEVGEPAVTRVPRRMMADAVAEGLVECGWPPETGVRARVSVPNGEEIAKETTNARLGVLNGISILGQHRHRSALQHRGMARQRPPGY